MIGKDFVFDSKRLSNYGFVMASPDAEDSYGLSRDVLQSETNMYRTEVNHYGTVSSDVIKLNFFVVKKVCSSDTLEEISQYEFRDFASWLMSPTFPLPLQIVGKDGKVIEFNGVFTDIAPYTFNGINGIKFTFTCNSSFGFEIKDMKFNIVDTDGEVIKAFMNDNDDRSKLVYPVITIKNVEPKEYRFTNLSNNSFVSLTFKKEHSEVVVDGLLKRMYGDGKPLSLSDVTFTNSDDKINFAEREFMLSWLKFNLGQNKIKFKGKGIYKVEYKLLRRYGGLVNV